jgi:hypothetical protein
MLVQEKSFLGLSYENPHHQIQEEDSLGTTWARFSALTQICRILSIPKHMLLRYFWFGLFEDAGLQLDTLSEGSFFHEDPTKGKELLDRIREITPSVSLHNDAPLRRECIERPRTIIS